MKCKLCGKELIFGEYGPFIVGTCVCGYSYDSENDIHYDENGNMMEWVE